MRWDRPGCQRRRRRPAWAAAHRARSQRAHAAVRGHHVPRDAVQVGVEQGARCLDAAVPATPSTAIAVARTHAGTASPGPPTSTSTWTAARTSTPRSWSRPTSPTCCAANCAGRRGSGETVALGTNTDPYQRAEGRYALMPGIIGALADSGTPFSILTKGTLLRRDLPLIAEAARRVDVSVAVSLAVGDPELHKDVEPGTPSPQARLGLISAIRDAGLDCHVMVAPVLPLLTDSAAAPRLAARPDRRGRRDGCDGFRAAPAWLDARLVHGVVGAVAPRAGRAVPRVVPARRLSSFGLPKDAARQGDTVGRQARPCPGSPVVSGGGSPQSRRRSKSCSRRCSRSCCA